MFKRTMMIFMTLNFMLASVGCSSEFRLDNPQKIAEVYEANEELFNAVAEKMMAYSQVKWIDVTMDEEAFRAFLEDDTPPVGRDYKEINGMYIMASEKLSDADYQNIYNAFAPLLTALKDSRFQSEAATSYNQINFMVEGPVYGKSAELYYYQEKGHIPPHQKEEWILQINDHWFALNYLY